MTYSVNVNGKRYELPARTLEIDSKIEELQKSSAAYQDGEITRREIVQRQFDFLAICTPGAFEDVETADTNEILSATVAVIETYNAPAIKVQADATLSQIRPVLNTPEMQKALLLLSAQKKP